MSDEYEKKPKAAVRYSPGMASSHCGPVKGWPRGECVHFIAPSGCDRVRGDINPRFWCTLWAKKENGS